MGCNVIFKEERTRLAYKPRHDFPRISPALGDQVDVAMGVAVFDDVRGRRQDQTAPCIVDLNVGLFATVGKPQKGRNAQWQRRPDRGCTGRDSKCDGRLSFMVGSTHISPHRFFGQAEKLIGEIEEHSLLSMFEKEGLAPILSGSGHGLDILELRKFTDATNPACYGEGWLGAGSWYMTIARNNAHIATLMTAEAEASSGGFINDFERATESLIENSGNGSGWFGGVRNRDWAGLLEPEAALRHWESYTNAYQRDTVALAALGYTLDASQTLLVSAASEERGAKAVERFTAEWQEQVITNMASFGGWFDSDPMVKLIDLGQTLIYAAGFLMTIMLLPFMDAAAISPLMTMIWGAGAFLAFILPLMPYILWVVAVTGYFLLVVEAVVAVTLWAFAHLRMDGDGISGAATAGWTMLLSLILTPVLMVFGFIVGMTIFRVTAGLLIGGIFPAMSGILGGTSGFIFLLALPAIVVMVAIMMLVLIERSFSLISEFPNRVLAWIGGRTDLADQGALDRTRAGMIGGAAGLGAGGSQVLNRMGNASDRLGKAALGKLRGRVRNGGGGGGPTNNP